MTELELEFIPDPDLYIFFEKGTRGRISYISNRSSKANNKYLKYYDASNLYGYPMSKFLPTSGFKWIDPKELDMKKYTNNSSIGSVFEVDLECSKELCKLQKNYPLVPDKLEIKRETLSKYQLLIADLHSIPIDNLKKIVPYFFDKEKYLFYYQNLQLYLRL